MYISATSRKMLKKKILLEHKLKTHDRHWFKGSNEVLGKKLEKFIPYYLTVLVDLIRVWEIARIGRA